MKLERHNKELQKHLEEVQRVRYTDAEAELRNYIEWSDAKDQGILHNARCYLCII